MICIISVPSISQASAVIDVTSAKNMSTAVTSTENMSTAVTSTENMSTARKTLIYSVLTAGNLLVEMFQIIVLKSPKRGNASRRENKRDPTNYGFLNTKSS